MAYSAGVSVLDLDDDVILGGNHGDLLWSGWLVGWMAGFGGGSIMATSARLRGSVVAACHNF